MYKIKRAYIEVIVNGKGRGTRWGLENSSVFIDGRRYLDRFIVYARGTLRLHRFWRGDDTTRGPHTHPWWFVTFPFTSYKEEVYHHGVLQETRVVKAFNFHYRHADFEHIVKGRADGKMLPFYTIVITGRARSAGSWGFYPMPGLFRQASEWRKQNG